MECPGGKKEKICRVESIYLMICTKFKGRICQSIRKLVFENFMQQILLYRFFFFPPRHFIGILEMDFEGIFVGQIV